MSSIFSKHHNECINETLTDVSNEFHNFFVEIDDLLQSTAALTGEELANAKDEIRLRINAAEASMERARNSIAFQTQKTAARVDGYVHKKPWTLIGTGLAIGVLVGFLLANRKDD